MYQQFPTLFLIVGSLLLLSVLGNRVSRKFGVPILLVFLLIGMVVGPDGFGNLNTRGPNAEITPNIANFVGMFALSFILFSGGLDTNWRNAQRVIWPATILATAGVLLTAAIMALFCIFVIGMDWQKGCLLGAIVSSTDAAAVFGVLRSGGVSLKGNMQPLLEMESGSNDPMAMFITMVLMSIVSSDSVGAGFMALKIGGVLVDFLVGICAGAVFGKVAALLLRKLRLEYEGLYPVLSLSIVMITFGLADLVHGNGYLAVYVCGIVLGNSEFPNKRYLCRFYDGVGWLMQIVLFITLGLFVYPLQLPSVAGKGLLAAFGLMFIARPAAVFLCMIKSKFTMRERTFAAWTGLRGAVPIVLATLPLAEGHDHDRFLFNMVFFIVLASVLTQGKTLMLVARWLGLNMPLKTRAKSPIEFERSPTMKGDMSEIEIPTDSTSVNKEIKDLGLPRNALILLIQRGDDFIVPKGDTVIGPADILTLVAPPDELSAACSLLMQTVAPATVNLDEDAALRANTAGA